MRPAVADSKRNVESGLSGMEKTLSLAEYLALAKQAPRTRNPDPFTNPKGDWQSENFERAVKGLTALLRRIRENEATEEEARRGDDTGPQKENRLNYWLYIQHHPPAPMSDWKRLGQPYWSVEAWRSYRDWRVSGRDEFPAKKDWRGRGLELDHVVPKRKMENCVLADGADIRFWLKRNAVCVLTVDQHNSLRRKTHPDPADPWLRYKGEGIVLLHNNRAWKAEEIEILFGHGLLDRSSVTP